MFRRQRTTNITPEQEKVLEKAVEQRAEAEEILEEVRTHSRQLKIRREKNHFAEGFRLVLWGNNGN
jgi:ribosomal protein S19